MGKLRTLRPFLWDSLLRRIFSPRCVFCQEKPVEEWGICTDCSMEKSALKKLMVQDGILSLFSYEGKFKDLLLDLKKGRNYPSFLPMAGWIYESLSRSRDFVVILAPPSQKRRRQEGIDPMLLIGRALAGKRLTVTSPFYKTGVSQKMLSRDGRKTQIKIALHLKRGQDLSSLRGKTVWILDDLVTTGATLGEMEERLQEAGVERINKLVLAQAPKRN